jgi:tRNA dimethylallyltransferase
MAKKALEEIYANGQIPIIAGGTGFYIQALLYDIDFEDQDADMDYRRTLEEYVKTYGAHALHERLRDVDTVSYETIHENNVKRTIRALEFYEKTKTPISEHNEAEREKQSPYNFAYFVLTDERKHLYERIDRRVDVMMEQGLVAEVQKLKDMGCSRQMVSMQGLGYKEILDYLDGKCSLEEAVYIIKRETRHFAKRQLTWFRREREVIWLDKQQYGYEDGKILADMCRILEEKGIIKELS